MRTTLTIDHDVASLLKKENRKAQEPMGHSESYTSLGLASSTKLQQQKRLVVKPLDTGITREQWESWNGRKLEDVMDKAKQLDSQ